MSGRAQPKSDTCVVNYEIDPNDRKHSIDRHGGYRPPETHRAVRVEMLMNDEAIRRFAVFIRTMKRDHDWNPDVAPESPVRAPLMLPRAPIEAYFEDDQPKGRRPR